MIAEWLAAMAAAGGRALVAAVATDAWEGTRTGVAGLFGRGGDRRRELASQWADETIAAIASATEHHRDAVAQQLAKTWQQRLADLVREFPDAAEPLRVWTRQVRETLPEAQRTWVDTSIAHDDVI